MSTTTDRVAASATPVTTWNRESTKAPGSRVVSVDVIRGVIMILMAVDHVRVYSGLPAESASLPLFFTRWITHFCAPGFALLAGTAAYFHGEKLGGISRLQRFLVTRGALLVLLELTVVRLSWTFSPSFTPLFAGVIWMLGWSMIVLAALVPLGPKRVGWIGVAIMAFQQLLALVPSLLPTQIVRTIAPVWRFVYPLGGPGDDNVIVLYVLVPWIGVMACGYGLGALLRREPSERDRLCLRIGLAATVLFLLVAGALAWRSAPANATGSWLVRLLNQRKYPASQLFLLMTLGPLIAALPAAARVRGRTGTVLQTIGGVPLFYYLLHIPLIHASALVVNLVRSGATHGEWYVHAPFVSIPAEQRWPLWLLYAVFVVDVALLYAACRWYAAIKRRDVAGRLRYL